jgi:hypothetical protein
MISCIDVVDANHSCNTDARGRLHCTDAGAGDYETRLRHRDPAWPERVKTVHAGGNGDDISAVIACKPRAH